MAAEKKPLKDDTPTFQDMVRELTPVRLGDAKRYAAALPTEQQAVPCCGCYKVHCPNNACCCRSKCVGVACPMVCCPGCMWTPAFFCFVDLFIGLCFCNCRDDANPGSYSCVDLKGNLYALVKVDGERGTLAWFTENQVLSSEGDNLEAKCYCLR